MNLLQPHKPNSSPFLPDMTMEEVREYERTTQEATNLKIGSFPPAISISETPLPSSTRSGPNSAPSTPLSTEAPEFLSVPKERPRKKSAPETLTLPDPGRRDSIFKLPSFFSWNSSPQPEWEAGCATGERPQPVDQWRMPAQHIPQYPLNQLKWRRLFRSWWPPAPSANPAGVTAKPTGTVWPPQLKVLWGLKVTKAASPPQKMAPRIRQDGWSPTSQTECSIHSWKCFIASFPSKLRVCWRRMLRFSHCTSTLHVQIFVSTLALKIWVSGFDISVLCALETDQLFLATVSVEYYGFHSQVLKVIVVILYIKYSKKIRRLIKTPVLHNEYNIQW